MDHSTACSLGLGAGVIGMAEEEEEGRSNLYSSSVPACRGVGGLQGERGNAHERYDNR